MKFYRCDHCMVADELNEPIVQLCKPDGAKHFCSATCFWTWAEKYFPTRPIPTAEELE